MDQCHEPDAVGRDAQELLLFQHTSLDGSVKSMDRCDWPVCVATMAFLNLQDLRAPAETDTLVRIRYLIAQLTPKARTPRSSHHHLTTIHPILVLYMTLPVSHHTSRSPFWHVGNTHLYPPNGAARAGLESRRDMEHPRDFSRPNHGSIWLYTPCITMDI